VLAVSVSASDFILTFDHVAPTVLFEPLYWLFPFPLLIFFLTFDHVAPTASFAPLCWLFPFPLLIFSCLGPCCSSCVVYAPVPAVSVSASDFFSITFDHVAPTASFAPLCRLFPFPLLHFVLVHHNRPVNLYTKGTLFRNLIFIYTSNKFLN
jgi:hypothetical protein